LRYRFGNGLFWLLKYYKYPLVMFKTKSTSPSRDSGSYFSIIGLARVESGNSIPAISHKILWLLFCVGDSCQITSKPNGPKSPSSIHHQARCFSFTTQKKQPSNVVSTPIHIIIIDQNRSFTRNAEIRYITTPNQAIGAPRLIRFFIFPPHTRCFPV